MLSEMEYGIMSSLKSVPLAPEAATPPSPDESVSREELYAQLADRGLRYGAYFQGVQCVWRQGEEICADVRLSEGLAAEDFLVHPAILDSALHAALVPFLGRDDHAYLPFVWRGVRLRKSSARTVRVRIVLSGEHTLSMSITDDEGRVVASVDSLLVRPLTAGQAGFGAADGQLMKTVWRPARPAATVIEHQRRVLLGADFLRLTSQPTALRGLHAAHPTLRALRAAVKSEGAPQAVLISVDGTATITSALQRALVLIQEFLSDEQLAQTRLVFLTQGGVCARPGEKVPDLAAAAVWGLVRSAQLEHPGRFGIIDVDAGWSWPALNSAIAVAAPQLAVRSAGLLCPRLVPAGVPSLAPGAAPWAADRTVLVTGGTGALGSLVARHLAETHGVRNLMLLSRRGLDAPGARDLVRELADRGARAEVVACDTRDPAALTQAVSAIDTDCALGTVIHAGGVTADRIVSSLTPRDLAHVLDAKLESALNLHRLTAGLPDCRLVLFSSAAGVLGSAGQANYAAANTALDALAQQRGAAGLPTVSLAWGLWEDDGGMGSTLGQADRARLSRTGIVPLSPERGLALLDAAVAGDNPILVPIRLDLAALRSGSAPVPEMLLDLAPAKLHATATSDEAKAFRVHLATLNSDDQEQALLDLVRSEVAAVLGHDSGDAITAASQFLEIGFDSLTNLELSRRLSAATAARLPNTLAFDHSTPAELAAHLKALLT